MQIFLYVLLGAVFVLGVLFIQAYRRTGVGQSARRPPEPDRVRGLSRRQPRGGAPGRRGRGRLDPPAGPDRGRGLRRTAATEVEALRRAARSDAASLTAAAEAAVAKAERRPPSCSPTRRGAARPSTRG